MVMVSKTAPPQPSTQRRWPAHSCEGMTVTSPSGNGTYAYQYDYRTRRVIRDESAAGGVLIRISFSGGTSVEEWDDTTSTPSLEVEYVRGSDWGGGVGGVLYSMRGGSPLYSHANARGDIIARSDTNGALTWQAAYEAFGSHPAETGTNPDRQRANSKDEDPTGLINDGFRYRDPLTGTFLTRDPIGFADGPNLYTYVHQNPWTAWDPEGLSEFGLWMPYPYRSNLQSDAYYGRYSLHRNTKAKMRELGPHLSHYSRAFGVNQDAVSLAVAAEFNTRYRAEPGSKFKAHIKALPFVPADRVQDHLASSGLQITLGGWLSLDVGPANINVEHAHNLYRKYRTHPVLMREFPREEFFAPGANGTMDAGLVTTRGAAFFAVLAVYEAQEKLGPLLERVDESARIGHLYNYYRQGDRYRRNLVGSMGGSLSDYDEPPTGTTADDVFRRAVEASPSIPDHGVEDMEDRLNELP